MSNMLGRKQRIKNDEWIEAFGKIEQTVSRKELDQLVDKTVKEIKKKTKGKKAAYAWSGGEGFTGARRDLPESRDKLLRPRNLRFGV